MQIRRLVILAMLGLSLTAMADFRTTMEVHEVELVYLRLPATESGTLAISDCADCNALVLRVNPATRYVLNKQTVSLVDFRKAVAGVRNRGDVIVDVFHDLATNTATTVRVKL